MRNTRQENGNQETLSCPYCTGLGANELTEKRLRRNRVRRDLDSLYFPYFAASLLAACAKPRYSAPEDSTVRRRRSISV